ncbi:MAG: DUF1998 domain-containing protein, partial [Planctomycetota bacterium]
VPVRPFPEWLVCSKCHRLAPISSGLFELKKDFIYPLKNRFVHINCNHSRKPPVALPVKFVLACEYGHLSDIPWNEFVHYGKNTCSTVNLRLFESGITGEVSDVVVKCDECGTKKSIADAFAQPPLFPECPAYHPHLQDHDDNCKGREDQKRPRTLLIGASNIWFPCLLSAISLPSSKTKLEELIEKYWENLSKIQNEEVLKGILEAGIFSEEFTSYDSKEIWQGIQKEKSKSQNPKEEEEEDLKLPEWNIFSDNNEYDGKDFKKGIPNPSVHPKIQDYFEKIVLMERLREVQTLIGFTRLSSPFEFGEIDPKLGQRLAPLSKKKLNWLPASEIRGEGIFIQLKESFLQVWLKKKEVQEREEQLFQSHVKYRTRLHFQNPQDGFPGMRYILLHTLSHVLMRQFALECGYSAASIRERIYSNEPNKTSNGQAMAGILLYTATPDSEGTLGGLVQLGEKDTFFNHLLQALERIHYCSSDPLCAENAFSSDSYSIRGSACHSCLYMPETSCEKGNKYLDRAVLVETLDQASSKLAVFQF